MGNINNTNLKENKNMNSLTSPGLIKAANEALVKSQAELNIARLFAYDMSNEFADYGFTVKVPVINAGEISAFNIESNDYENAQGTVSYVPVTLNKQPKATFKFTGNDILEAPNAPYWNKCAEAGAAAVREYISKELGGHFLSTEMTGGEATIGTISKANIAKLRAQCKARVADTVLALDPVTYAEVLSLMDESIYNSAVAVRDGKVDSLYGFKAVIQLNDLPTGCKGALIPADAIAFATRAVAVADGSIYSEVGTVTDDFGYTLTVMRHGSAAKGTGFINITTLMGCAVVKGDEIVLLK